MLVSLPLNNDFLLKPLQVKHTPFLLFLLTSQLNLIVGGPGPYPSSAESTVQNPQTMCDL